MTKKLSQMQKAYESIKSMIADGRIKPGSAVYEEDVAEQLEMSRTPVREALHRITSEGLLYRDSRRGLLVKIYTSDEILQNYQLTEALESMVAYLLAMGRKPECIDSLTDVMNDMNKALENEDHLAWLDHDERFHQLMLDYCNNKYITDILERTNVIVKNVRLRYTRLFIDHRVSNKYHQMLLEAIKEGDVEKARRIWQKHLSEISKKIIEFI